MLNSDLNDSLYDSGWLNSNIIYYRKKHGVVYIQYNYNSTTYLIYNGQILGTLPEGYRPKFPRFISNYVSNVYLYINPENGNCTVVFNDDNASGVSYAHFYDSYPAD